MPTKVFFIFCIAFLHCQAKGLPSVSTPDDYYSSDDYYSYSSDDDYLSSEEKVVHTNPEFLSDSTNDWVNEGETIKLPCLVDKLEGFVLMWKKGKDMIALGDRMMGNRGARFRLEKSENGNTLVISLAEPDDAGEYSCQISASRPMELRHSVSIRVAPQIRPVPQNGRLVVYQGEAATLGCDILRGNPTPEIKWRRKERKMPSGEEEVRGLSITFTSTSRHHSGIYTCSADNGFGRAINATITLDVQHAPQVEQEQTFIHTNEYDETEVICIVHASPRAEVTWFKNGSPMSDDEGILNHRGNRYALILPGIKSSTFGQYKCKATNKFGSDEKTTEVSGQATPVNFKSDPMGQQEHYFNMEWVTESISPVTNFKLQYKEEDTYYSINAIRDDTDDWTEVQVVPQSNGDHYYAGRYTIDKLSPAKNYVARVASKNDYGYSKFSQAFRFGTKGAVPVRLPIHSGGGSSHSISICLTMILVSIHCYYLKLSS